PQRPRLRPPQLAGLLVAMHDVGRESRQADRDVLGALGVGAAIAHPLARLADDRLAGGDARLAALVLDADAAAQHHSDLGELGALAGLLPAAGRAHARHAHLARAGAGAADELLDQLRLVAGGLDDDGS